MALNDTLSIDIARRGTIHIPAKQADHGYDIVCTILRNGENIVDASTDTATFRVGKPDNTFYYGDATVNADNTVSIHVDDEGQMLAVPGYAVVDVTLNDGNGAVKSTQNFVLDVQAAPGGEAIPSSSVFIELEALVAEAEESIPGATQAATAANAAAAAANAAAEAATEAAEDAQGAAQHSVRYDTDQTLTTAQQAQALENIGGASNDDVNDIKSAITITEDYKEKLIDGAYIKTNGNIGTTVDTTPVQAAGWKYIIIPCVKGDSVTITGYGGNTPRLWATVDSSYKMLSNANSTVSVSDLVVTATQDGYFIINFDASKTIKLTVTHYGSLQDIIDEINSEEVKAFEWATDDIPVSASFSDYAGIATSNPTLSELYALYDALVTAYPDYVSKTDLGMDQSNTYHLYKYTFSPERIPYTGVTLTIPKLPKVLLGSGIHGDGTQGDKKEMVVGLYYFFYNLCHNWASDDALSYLRWNVRFDIIPVMNPWGYVNDSRGNSRGVDLNRNFPYGWSGGTSGNPDYGGASSLSEAESVIIKNFIEDNTDALFFYDIHTVGSTAAQNKMIYFDMFNGCSLVVPANSVVIQLSRKWDAENIGGLTAMNYHGYVHSVNGLGMLSTWVNHNYMPSSVFEGFPSFTGESIVAEGDKIMSMCLDIMFTTILNTLRYFRYE